MLSEKEILKIKSEIKQAALDHINAKDLETALSHFTKDIVAVSNQSIFSFDTLKADIEEYYNSLKNINYASWENIHIHVINDRAATFTAKFKYGFTNNDDNNYDLNGVWSALFVFDDGRWKIRLRHESFKENDK